MSLFNHHHDILLHDDIRSGSRYAAHWKSPKLCRPCWADTDELKRLLPHNRVECSDPVSSIYSVLTCHLPESSICWPQMNASDLQLQIMPLTGISYITRSGISFEFHEPVLKVWATDAEHDGSIEVSRQPPSSGHGPGSRGGGY